jgi:hypothetical protein
MIAALAAITAANLYVFARAAQPDAFSRLVADPEAIETRIAANGRGVYATLGGTERFVLERDDRKATIRFLCDATSPGCTELVRTSHALRGTISGHGDLVFKSAAGAPVLRVHATGGATLLEGAPFVPDTVPVGGRAVIRAD